MDVSAVEISFLLLDAVRCIDPPIVSGNPYASYFNFKDVNISLRRDTFVSFGCRSIQRTLLAELTA